MRKRGKPPAGGTFGRGSCELEKNFTESGNSGKNAHRSGPSTPIHQDHPATGEAGPAVFIVVFVVLVLLTVPLAGGKLSRLADVELRGVPFIVSALVLQILIVSVVPDGHPTVHRAIHLLTYGLAAAFLVMNRRIPGMPVIAMGALCNVAAIIANGGQMPASPDALRAAGEAVKTSGFINSGIVAHPKLLVLGDIFAIPKWMPLHNVFSVGDVCIAVGATIAIHALCRPTYDEPADQPGQDAPLVASANPS